MQGQGQGHVAMTVSPLQGPLLNLQTTCLFTAANWCLSFEAEYFVAVISGL